MNRRFAGVLAGLLCAGAVVWGAQQGAQDPIFEAMKTELTRSMSLSLKQLEKPYYISYAIETGHQWGATAVMGGLLGVSSEPFRYPQLQLRVGDYKFDQTNFAGGGRGPSYALSGFPLDNNPDVIRQYLWLETDSAYKASLDAIARKRSVLRSVTVSDELPDFDPAKPNTILKDRPLIHFDDKTWDERTRRVSAVFDNYPNLRASVADYNAIDSIHRYVDSEGAAIRLPQSLGQFQIRASAQAPDGMIMRDSALFYTSDLTKMPSEAELTAAAKNVAEGLTKLAAAPMGENYSGPVLFEGVAGPQLLAELLAPNLHISRKPTGARASNPTELEGRRGVRIMPEMFDVVDDPTLPLFGHTEVDDEGVIPHPMTMVEKGVLKDFYRTRTPVRGYNDSNGHSLMGGATAPTNLIITSHETSSISDLKKKMIDLCQQRGLEYAIIVKKMDFPSTAVGEEMRSLMGNGGGGRPVAMPLYVYKLFLDGHEEQIRGVRLRGVNARSLKDILAAGDDENRLDYLENGVPFAEVGGGGYTAAVTVEAPSLLIDDLELTRMEDELPKLPTVSSPLLSQK
ncbi:MAG TPA: metallopeptidase TldD-related protein [Bryobacteraceae bacterium]|nr:metallopeptidase TldD-related protein [Bryobacteraceae bacterium]